MNYPFDRSVLALRVIGNTAHPQDNVPIYLMHTLENPFCPLPGCWCHTDQERIALVLEAIKNGEMTLREAADFVDGRTV